MVYDLLFRTAAETLLTIAADPKHLGARLGATAVLHTWGSAMTHHLTGCTADAAFSYQCACCPACSGGSSWPDSQMLMRRVG